MMQWVTICMCEEKVPAGWYSLHVCLVCDFSGRKLVVCSCRRCLPHFEIRPKWQCDITVFHVQLLRFTGSFSGRRVSRTSTTDVLRVVLSIVSFSDIRIGGTVGAITTCPLEVVKTRLQSSVVSLDAIEKQPYLLSQSVEEKSLRRPVRHRFFIYRFIRHIVETEGPKALFKGLGPNLIGVAPSRSVWFTDCVTMFLTSFRLIRFQGHLFLYIFKKQSAM